MGNFVSILVFLLFSIIPRQVLALSAVEIHGESAAGQVVTGSAQMWIDRAVTCSGLVCPPISRDEMRKLSSSGVTKFEEIRDLKALRFVNNPIYIRFKIHASGDSRKIVFAHVQSWIDSVEAFVRYGNDEAFEFVGRDGDAVRTDGAALGYRYPAFSATLGSERPEAEILLRIRSSSFMRHEYRVWDYQAFDRLRMYEMCLLTGCLGILMMIFIYNMVLFFNTRRSIYVHYSGYVVAVMLILWTYYGYANIFFEGALKTLAMNHGLSILGGAVNLFAVPYSMQFFSIKSKKLETANRVYYVLIAAYIVWCIVDVERATNAASHVCIPGSLLMIALAVWGVRQRFVPAYYFLAGWVSLIFGNVTIILQTEGVITSTHMIFGYSLIIGVTVEAIMLSLGIGDKVGREQRKARNEIRSLNYELKEINQNLEHKVMEKTRDVRALLDNLPLGVFAISDPFKRTIDRDRSTTMERMFGLSENESHTIDSVLLDKAAGLSADSRSLIHTTLMTSIGESDLAFSANAGHLPRELEIIMQERPYTLELDWSCVLEDDGETVQKILVSCKDVTELRKYQQQIVAQKSEMQRIGELVSIEDGKLKIFFESMQRLIVENEQRLLGSVSAQDIKMILVNLHTAKGAARTIGFKDLSTLIHEAESLVCEATGSDKRAELWRENEKIKAMLGEYMKLAKDKLRKTFGEDGQVLVQRKVLARVVDKSVQGLAAEGEDLKALMGAAYVSLESELEGFRITMERVAKDLGKEKPSLHGEGVTKGVYLTSDAGLVVSAAFMHLGRNAVDHGIESASEREQKGKPRAGRVDIHVSVDPERGTVLRMKDDGRGLALDRIRDQAVKRGLISDASSLLPAEIAALVFEDGLSTAKTLSEISGRGVGMGAIRKMIEELGGEFAIAVNGPVLEGFAPFEFVLTIPAAHIRTFTRGEDFGSDSARGACRWVI